MVFKIIESTECSEQEVRALSQHVIAQPDTKLNQVLGFISEGLRYGHTLEVRIVTQQERDDDYDLHRYDEECEV